MRVTRPAIWLGNDSSLRTTRQLGPTLIIKHLAENVVVHFSLISAFCFYFVVVNFVFVPRPITEAHYAHRKSYYTMVNATTT